MISALWVLEPTTKRVLLTVGLLLAASLAALGFADVLGFGPENADAKPPPCGPMGCGPR
jgi:hypothetical protein